MITLKAVLRANAASCLLFATIFALIPQHVSLFLSAEHRAPEYVIWILAGVLMINGLHLIWASLRQSPPKLLIYYFSFGDFIWVLLSITLICANTWVTSTQGRLFTLLVSAIVGIMGVLQLTLQKKTNQ
ncbi:hypothetical protein [Pseudoalteromonas sp. S16_S37]|uniref:hypothetical protein n=1 Tax=Pseudoalteromonas sp. S16_S37 TaxID=2720228 RepID=UPI0016815BAD|nr:hypothetical protein [Pseudoalteromonas sp. S16_S37]MBD1584637.1 hypothetical protein [Pseudoalteromonas sp. S16_S37]